MSYSGTTYKIKALGCDNTFEDENWVLDCPNCNEPALIRADYANKQLELLDLPGLYQFAQWLPIHKTLAGSGTPITYKSEGLGKQLGIKNLYITFNGYWPEKGALMKTGSFKECEAYAVCGRLEVNNEKIMVVASAGNTARAFAKVCSENNIPLLITIPEDNLSALWFDEPLNDCVKIVASEKGADYYDAIHLSGLACSMDKFFPEGGAKNIARRDGMGTTVLSAVTTIGKIPDYYFQAVGSGTGAIAAWEANLRFISDERFGSNKMKLMVSQNEPFIPIKNAWEADSRNLLPFKDDDARKEVETIIAKVLSNRKPPYSIKGGLYDAMKDAGGEVLTATNEEALEAMKLFEELEGIDIDPAAAVAAATLISYSKNNPFNDDEIVMLNITGGGEQRFKKDHNIIQAKPSIVFPIDPDPEMVKTKLEELFS